MDGILEFFKICWKYNKKYVIILFSTQIIGVVVVITGLYFPKIILSMLFDDSRVRYISMIIYVFLFIVVQLILNVSKYKLMEISANERMKVFNLFQIDLSRYLHSIKLEKLESKEFLDLKSKADLYLYSGGKGFANILEDSFNILGIISSLIIYAIIISKLNIILLCLISILIFLNIQKNYKYQRKNTTIELEKSIHERKSSYYSNISQDFSYGKEIRMYGISNWLLDKYKLQLNKMEKFYVILNKNNFSYYFSTSIIGGIEQVISYIYLITEVFNKEIGVGDFSLFLNAISSFSSSIRNFTEEVIALKQYTLYYDAYKKYIGYDIEERINSGSTVETKCMCIKFNDVSFKYPFDTEYAIKDINITIGDGDKLAIVGKNGAGKSTFIKLLLRIYEPTSGFITFNGIDIKTIPYKEYIKLFSAVFQDYKIFADTIEENILFGYESNRDSLYEILQKLDLESKIESLEKGVKTNIYKIFDEEGYVPSGGEEQKIVFARALYKNSHIIVLDEPSSALDPYSEDNLYRLISNISNDKICIFISHRLAACSFSSKILVFDKGELVEQGKHDKLMESRGVYYKMYEAQSKYYK